MKILMVCLGNICRSPLAEGILQQKAAAAGLDWQVDSAGTNGYHTGEAPHLLSQKVARLNGLDISQQRARRFTAEDLTNYDRVYALAGDVVDQIRRIGGRGADLSKVQLLMNELHPGQDEDVPDPYYGAEPGYHEVYEMIDKAADSIVTKYGTHPATSPAQSKMNNPKSSPAQSKTNNPKSSPAQPGAGIPNPKNL
ncbi:MAG TPA: low molecular weight protein-tyrosine-phosphatase [Puia sp.]|nr:low molecular weight protein-tyrosine-phosphatase [Puia sp.]